MKQNVADGIWIGLIVALLSVSAFIRIPMYPVPLTMQGYVVLLIPMVFGAKRSFFGVLLYIILGLAGLPIFSSGGGFGYVLKPTFGYMVGFLPAVVVSGLICKRFPNIAGYIASGLLSSVVFLLIGVVGLYFNMNFVQHKEMFFITAFEIGLFPFIIPDLIKVALAVATAPVINSVLKRSFLFSRTIGCY